MKKKKVIIAVCVCAGIVIATSFGIANGVQPGNMETAKAQAAQSAEPSGEISATATPTPTVKPTATPTAKPTATPTAKPTTTPTASPTPGATATPKPETGSGGGSQGGGGGSQGSGGSTPDPNAGKTWHDAVYEEVWVVDVPASSYEETVYEERHVYVCNDCDAINPSSEHIFEHAEAGGKGSSHTEYRQIPVGTKTVNVPEKGHWEKRLVREAGYY
jgi:hypothetical protein